MTLNQEVIWIGTKLNLSSWTNMSQALFLSIILNFGWILIFSYIIDNVTNIRIFNFVKLDMIKLNRWDHQIFATWTETDINILELFSIHSLFIEDKYV